jgi:hypothetical protein
MLSTQELVVGSESKCEERQRKLAFPDCFQIQEYLL